MSTSESSSGPQRNATVGNNPGNNSGSGSSGGRSRLLSKAKSSPISKAENAITANITNFRAAITKIECTQMMPLEKEQKLLAAKIKLEGCLDSINNLKDYLDTSIKECNKKRLDAVSMHFKILRADDPALADEMVRLYDTEEIDIYARTTAKELLNKRLQQPIGPQSKIPEIIDHLLKYYYP